MRNIQELIRKTGYILDQTLQKGFMASTTANHVYQLTAATTLLLSASSSEKYTQSEEQLPPHAV